MTIATALAHSLRPASPLAGRSDLLPVYGLSAFSLQDFPDRSACIVWFAGCNMRCGYCHNPQIVRGKGTFDMANIMDFLDKRQGLLDGVVLSGGEATLYPALLPFARDVKDMGYAIKLDTNGTRPDTIATLLREKLLDYVALDYKAPRGKYTGLTRHQDFDAFSRTLDMLCASDIPFEVRTTVHTDLLDERDITAIMDDLSARGFTGTYYIQNYVSTGRPTLRGMAAQRRALDFTKIQPERAYTLAFRNF